MSGFYSGSTTADDNTVIAGIGVTGADKVKIFDNAFRELVAQAKRFALDLGGAVTVGGTGDAITVTTNSLDSGDYVNGFAVTFIAGADNGTTTPTINIDNRGSKKLKKAVLGAETAPAAANIKSGGIYKAFYRSTWDGGTGAFQIIDMNVLNVPDYFAADLGEIHVVDQKTSGTSGGAASAGANIRTLNTVKKNSIIGATLSSNTVSLPAGTYSCWFRAPAMRVNEHKVKLETTGGTALVIGSSEYSENNTLFFSTSSFGEGEFTLASTTSVRLSHYCGSAQAAVNALGQAATTGDVEIFSELFIKRIS